MATTSSKDKAYEALKDGGSRITIDLVRDLLIAFRDENRESNDTSEYKDVLRNQGANRLCNELLETWINFDK